MIFAHDFATHRRLEIEPSTVKRVIGLPKRAGGCVIVIREGDTARTVVVGDSSRQVRIQMAEARRRARRTGGRD